MQICNKESGNSSEKWAKKIYQQFIEGKREQDNTSMNTCSNLLLIRKV
jgi:hypothetical protein